MNFRINQILIQIADPPCMSCVTLGKPFTFSASVSSSVKWGHHAHLAGVKSGRCQDKEWSLPYQLWGGIRLLPVHCNVFLHVCACVHLAIDCLIETGHGCMPLRNPPKEIGGVLRA